MGMPWVKIYVSILDDIKLARLTDAQKWRFVQMILLANECDAGGAIVTGVTLLSPSDITPLSHKEEEEEEEEDLNPKKSLTENEYKERIKKTISRGTNTHEQLQNTFFELFHINVNWDRKDGKLFLQWLKERPPDQTVEKFAEWWKTQDWRGKSGQPPTIHQIQELWPQAFIPVQDSPASIASEVY